MNKSLVFFCLLAAAAPALQAAEGEREHSRRDIAVLDEAASALRASNPRLSSQLTAYATRESSEKEGIEAKGASATANLRMLREAVAALKPSRPELAKDLESYADREESEQKRMSHQDIDKLKTAPPEKYPSQGY